MQTVRTVVTGMGAITPLGNTIDTFWESLVTGKSGISKITRFDTSEYSARIAAEVNDFDGADYLEKKEIRRLDMVEQFAIAASQLAVDDAGVDFDKFDRFRTGVVIGSGIGGIFTFEKQHKTLLESGPGRVSPFFIPMMIIDMCSGLVAIRFGLKGPNYATVSACSSSSHAILDAFKIIQRGDADLIIAGGAESTITPTSVAGFCSARALSTRNDEPEAASRPFDKDRDGFVMGEGAGILVLESLDSALKRGAKIYCEIIGAGMTCDAHHMTAPIPDGSGAQNSMKFAIDDAGLKPDEVDYINSHGTATPLGDPAETNAIKNVFGERAYKIPINSTKSMVGHLLGAAGAVEFIAGVKSLETGVIHPTINLDNPDPQCDLDYVAEGKREMEFDTFLSNSFGFGGHNVSLLARKYNG
jgi:3-oxoacyl-[acyl-carrier-protein] synthase II